MPGRYTVILVYSTGHAIQAERLLHRAGIGSRLVPVPRHLSSDCGVCLQIAQADGEAVEQVLQEASVQIEGIYEI